jgi:PKD repeat protein
MELKSMKKQTILTALLFFFLLSDISFCQYPFISPESITYDPGRNRYLVSDQGNGDIIQIDSLGNYSPFNTGLTIAKGMIVRNDTLFVAAGYQGIAAFDLETAQLIMLIGIPGMVELNDIAADSIGNIYVSDAQGHMIHKLHLADSSTSTIVTGFNWANGLWYDHYNNRLLAIQWINDCPISAVDLTDYTVSTIRNDGLDLLDGITRDIEGNYYVSSFGSDAIHKYDSLFSNPPELFSGGHTDPGDIYFNKWRHEIGVPYVSGGQVAFVKFVSMGADTSYGFIPLEVEFTGFSYYSITEWNWNFNDGGIATGQTVSHEFENPGLHHITLNAVRDEDTISVTEYNYILALADTIAGSRSKGYPDSSIEVEIYANNAVPLDIIRIPVEYQGPLGLTLDSFTTAGCRTEHFDDVSQISSDAINRLAYFRIMNNYMSGTANLPAGSGIILKLYFTLSPSAPIGYENPIILDGYSDKELEFVCNATTYTPYDVDGSVSVFVCGDADDNGLVNILDITYLISFLYKGGPVPPYYDQANVNNDGSVNILDITYLISFLYKDGPDPDCP